MSPAVQPRPGIPSPGGVLLRTDLVTDRPGDFGELLGTLTKAMYECHVEPGYLIPFIVCKQVDAP